MIGCAGDLIVDGLVAGDIRFVVVGVVVGSVIVAAAGVVVAAKDK